MPEKRDDTVSRVGATSPKKRFSLFQGMKLAVAFFGIFLVVFLVASLSYHYQKKEVRKRYEEILLNISRFKAEQISSWYRERMADARTIFNTTHLAIAIQRWLESPDPEDGRQAILGRLSASQTSKDYQEVLLLDGEGVVRIRTEGSGHSLEAETMVLFRKAMTQKNPLFSDIYRCSQSRTIHLDFFVPLITQGAAGSRAIGVILFRIDPNQFLFPLIRDWPTVSRTSEAFIARREGDFVVYLSDLRYKKISDLSFRVPLSKKELPVVMAAMGQKGVVTGKDYRGVSVLAAIDRITDSPWFLVSKTDTAEVYAPVRSSVRLLVYFLLGMLIAISALLGLGVNLRQKKYYKKLYDMQLERQAVTKHFEYLVKYANDIIVLADHQGGIVEVNDRAVSTFNYNRDDFFKINLRDLFVSGGMGYTDLVIESGFTKEGTLWNAGCRRRDGTVFPAEVSGRLIDIEGAWFLQGIIRDMSDRSEAERVALEKSAYLDQLFNNIPLATQLCDVSGRIMQVNPATVRMFGYSSKEMLGRLMDELIIPDELANEAGKFTQRGNEGETLLFETRRRRKSGSIIDVFVIVFPVFTKNRRIGTYCIYQDISTAKEATVKIAQNINRLEKAILETIQALARVVENRDPYTANHQKRVAELSCAIAREMGVDAERIEGLRVGALVHDIGKIAIPLEILSKPTKLNDLEFSLIKLHSQSGFEILKDIDFPWPVARIVLEHHERINGSGYPQKLKGEDQLLESRILSVADVVEAMSSHRPYRPARGLEPALEEIVLNRSKLYDPQVVDNCLRLFREKKFQFAATD